MLKEVGRPRPCLKLALAHFYVVWRRLGTAVLLFRDFRKNRATQYRVFQ